MINIHSLCGKSRESYFGPSYQYSTSGVNKMQIPKPFHEKLEDIKELFRSNTSTKDRHYNSQNEQDIHTFEFLTEHIYLLCLVLAFIKRKSEFLWVPTTHFFSPTCSFVHMIKYRGFCKLKPCSVFKFDVPIYR